MPSKLLPVCAGLLLLLLLARPGWASGDLCAPDLAFHLTSSDLCENIAALTPANDTRVNLLLLLADRHHTAVAPAASARGPILQWSEIRDLFSKEAKPDPSDAEVGEGSRCRSAATGAVAFEAAANASNALSAEERQVLIAARSGLIPNCFSAAAPTQAVVETAARRVTSAAGNAFAIYLRGADAFYRGRFAEAAQAFGSLKGNTDPWLADSAAYMLARTRVNAMQTNAFDDYGTFKGSASIDQQTALDAEASLRAYLKDHADGRYGASAAGLLRRVAWLAGWNDKLAGYYAELLAKPPAVRNIDDVSLAQEIDSKLLPTLTSDMTRDPILLAVMDLAAMRTKKGPSTDRKRVDLGAQRDAFASAMPLFEFLTAADAFYVDGATGPVLKGLPDDTRRRDGDHLWFSRQFLRGEALEAANDRNARGFWRELHPGAARPLDRSVVELALALHEERHGGTQRVFAADSLVTDPAMRIVLLEHVAGPDLLRTQALNATASSRERQVALFTLLYKEATRTQYAEFLADLRDIPAEATPRGLVYPDPNGVADPPLALFTKGPSAGDIGCPALPTTIVDLSRDPEGIRERLCLAEFVRVNGMDQSPLDKPSPDGGLGATPSAYPGAPYARATTYKSIIGDKAASADDRAYALYRAVKCYEPTGGNQCGGADAPKAERKSWYNALKRDYPASRWAKALTYWW